MEFGEQYATQHVQAHTIDFTGVMQMQELFVVNLDTRNLVSDVKALQMVVCPKVTTSFIIGSSVTTTTTVSVFGPGSGPVFLADVHCTGSETTLLRCSHSKISLGSYCNHNRDVGVRCEGD